MFTFDGRPKVQAAVSTSNPAKKQLWHRKDVQAFIAAEVLAHRYAVSHSKHIITPGGNAPNETINRNEVSEFVLGNK